MAWIVDMRGSNPDSGWPAVNVPGEAMVSGATVNGTDRSLHLELCHRDSDWKGTIQIPAPWTFTSCLLALSSDQLELETLKTRPASELIGLEGASFSGVERGRKRIDLYFGSICVSGPA